MLMQNPIHISSQRLVQRRGEKNQRISRSSNQLTFHDIKLKKFAIDLKFKCYSFKRTPTGIEPKQTTENYKNYKFEEQRKETCDQGWSWREARCE